MQNRGDVDQVDGEVDQDGDAEQDQYDDDGGVDGDMQDDIDDDDDQMDEDEDGDQDDFEDGDEEFNEDELKEEAKDEVFFEDELLYDNDEWNTKWWPQSKEIIVQSILSAWDKIEWRKNAVGIFGFDLFPDNTGKLWLLEINKCPTMEYSTQVTKKLVPRFLEDMTELLMDKTKG